MIDGTVEGNGAVDVGKMTAEKLFRCNIITRVVVDGHYPRYLGTFT